MSGQPETKDDQGLKAALAVAVTGIERSELIAAAAETEELLGMPQGSAVEPVIRRFEAFFKL